MKKTPLYQQHIKQNGRMVDFAGWELPVEYKSSLAEAKATREFCGIFDASHMGEIEVAGGAALEFLQKLLSNDLSRLRPSQMQYNLILNPSGGVIDDCMVYCLGDKFLCVVNASNKDKVFAWFTKNKQANVEITDKSNELALISLQGPKAAEVVTGVIGPKAAELDYMSFLKAEIDGEAFLASRSGYTGEDGFEVYIAWGAAGSWWDKFLAAGETLGITACGLGARDILRIEAGYPLYGHEIDELTNPYEADLAWALKLNKEFVAKKNLSRIQQEGLKRKRLGLIMQEPGVPRQGYWLYSEDKLIGEITSGTYSPNLKQFIAMAYLDKQYAEIDSEIKVKIRDKLSRAKLVKFPFIMPRIKSRGRKFAAPTTKES